VLVHSSCTGGRCFGHAALMLSGLKLFKNGRPKLFGEQLRKKSNEVDLHARLALEMTQMTRSGHHVGSLIPSNMDASAA
jgi:hypothetical protein